MNYKYSILERLKSLPLVEYQVAKRKLPMFLNISKPQFDKYVYAKIGSKNNITVEKIAVLANYFECKIEDLLNEPIPIVNYEKLKQLEIDKKGLKFNIQ